MDLGWRHHYQHQHQLHRGWVHISPCGVGVISSFCEEEKEAEQREWERAGERTEREPAMRATLSASSSRPWALACSGSSGSLVSEVSEFVAREGERRLSMHRRESRPQTCPCARKASPLRPLRHPHRHPTTQSSSEARRRRTRVQVRTRSGIRGSICACTPAMTARRGTLSAAGARTVRRALGGHVSLPACHLRAKSEDTRQTGLVCARARFAYGRRHSRAVSEYSGA
ncbi:hypothetical protein B0H13DRAFT_633208 [Mycena leptocephala]|nr:hypothetical protein B0H13DRAFT_633208 [Mycena leptocephala]